VPVPTRKKSLHHTGTKPLPSLARVRNATLISSQNRKNMVVFIQYMVVLYKYIVVFIQYMIVLYKYMVVLIQYMIVLYKYMVVLNHPTVILNSPTVILNSSRWSRFVISSLELWIYNPHFIPIIIFDNFTPNKINTTS